MADTFEDGFFEDDLFFGAPAKHTGLCGKLSEIMKRPDNKLFPTIEDLLEDE